MSVDKLNAKKDEFVGTAKKVAGKVTGDKHLEISYFGSWNWSFIGGTFPYPWVP